MAYRVWSHNGMIIYTEKCCMVPYCFEAREKNQKFCKAHYEKIKNISGIHVHNVPL